MRLGKSSVAEFVEDASCVDEGRCAGGVEVDDVGAGRLVEAGVEAMPAVALRIGPLSSATRSGLSIRLTWTSMSHSSMIARKRDLLR